MSAVPMRTMATIANMPGFDGLPGTLPSSATCCVTSFVLRCSLSVVIAALGRRTDAVQLTLFRN